MGGGNKSSATQPYFQGGSVAGSFSPIIGGEDPGSDTGNDPQAYANAIKQDSDANYYTTMMDDLYQRMKARAAFDPDITGGLGMDDSYSVNPDSGEYGF